MSQEDLKLSVVMTTYNGERFIRQQLDSILNQKTKVDELLICDDGSIDHTISIIEEYKKKYPNTIRYYINEQNKGYAKNFWSAINKAKYDIIILSDQDDVWDENKTEVIKSAFVKHESVLSVNLGYRVIDENGTVIRSKKFRQFKNDGSEKKITFYEFIRSPRYPGMSMAFRKSAYDYVKGIDTKLVTAHDWVINQNASKNNGMLFIDKIVTSYRQHGKNTFGINALETSEKMIDGRITVVTDEILNYEHLMILYKDNSYVRRLYEVGIKRLEYLKEKKLLHVITNYIFHRKYIAFRGFCGDVYTILFCKKNRKLR